MDLALQIRPLPLRPTLTLSNASGPSSDRSSQQSPAAQRQFSRRGIHAGGSVQDQRRRLQVAIRQRRRLVKARAEFQRQLDRAMSQEMQQELRLRIKLDTTYLARPGFIAVFEFLGQRWVLGHQRSLRGEQWYFRAVGDQRLVCCGSQSLESQLCYALSQYCLQHHQSA
jgi:hypothetical protein